MTHIAKIVWLSDEQIAHLPADWFLDGDDVEISRDGDAVVLRRIAGLGERRTKPRADGPDDEPKVRGREDLPLPLDDPGNTFD